MPRYRITVNGVYKGLVDAETAAKSAVLASIKLNLDRHAVITTLRI